MRVVRILVTEEKAQIFHDHISIVAATQKEIVVDGVVIEMYDRKSQFSPHFLHPEVEAVDFFNIHDISSLEI